MPTAKTRMAKKMTKGAPEAHLLPRVIIIDKDLYDDDDEFVVPLQTDIERISMRKKCLEDRNEYDDADDYNFFEASLEEEYFKPITLPRKKRTICETHEEVDQFCKEAKEAMKSFANDDHVYMGLDTEKDGSTL